MTSVSEVARNWSRASEKGKGIGLRAEVLDMLNAMGVGELIQAKAAEAERAQCAERIKSSTAGANIASPGTSVEMDLPEPRISRSSGTTKPQDVIAAARRAQRASNRRKPN
ncbi:MAG TPA: hypothetical protein DEP91_03120 [Sphingomonas bacterium]|jgi:hypothetical protein|uniref:Uncharacterized protein n=1 Tax=Sphingomonas bacterium TaxID=1895847 RepID=A0A3D0W960_9SPHN|nr:hypothetical protein [Sphingomonas bacterium]